MSRTSHEQLVHFLSDMYSVEQQALAQMASAPILAEDPQLEAIFREHLEETRHQAAAVEERLLFLGGTSSVIKNAVMKLGGKGFLLFAWLQTETPGRLVAHAYAYEAMEWAGYAMLAQFADRSGDSQTATLASIIGNEERAMMRRLEAGFDAAEKASHRTLQPVHRADDLLSHLADAHALEAQGIHLLGKGDDIAHDPELTHACRQNLAASQRHAKALEARLAELGGTASRLKDTALSMGGLNWGFFFQAQSDTPAKLAAFVYAYEHLKIAGYELLLRTARHARDAATETLCETLLAEEREMALKVADTFHSAAEATLREVGAEELAHH